MSAPRFSFVRCAEVRSCPDRPRRPVAARACGAARPRAGPAPSRAWRARAGSLRSRCSPRTARGRVRRCRRAARVRPSSPLVVVEIVGHARLEGDARAAGLGVLEADGADLDRVHAGDLVTGQPAPAGEHAVQKVLPGADDVIERRRDIDAASYVAHVLLLVGMASAVHRLPAGPAAKRTGVGAAGRAPTSSRLARRRRRPPRRRALAPRGAVCRQATRRHARRLPAGPAGTLRPRPCETVDDRRPRWTAKPDACATWSSRDPPWRVPAYGCGGRSARTLSTTSTPSCSWTTSRPTTRATTSPASPGTRTAASRP